MISCLTLEMSRTISCERPSQISSSSTSSSLPIFASIGKEAAAPAAPRVVGVWEVAHDLVRAPLPGLVLEPLELVAHLREHRKGGVDAVVDDLVEQVAGALCEQRLAHVRARAGATAE